MRQMPGNGAHQRQAAPPDAERYSRGYIIVSVARPASTLLSREGRFIIEFALLSPSLNIFRFFADLAFSTGPHTEKIAWRF